MNPFYIGKSKTGNGLFASREIKKGEHILTFTGPRVPFDQTGLKGPKHYGDCLQIKRKNEPGAYIDLEEPGRTANHSCDPNSGIIDNTQLIAIKNIQKDEEIVFDYSTTMDENCWEMECHCGSTNCRKLIQDFKFLPSEIQQRYVQLGVVQQFILNSANKRIENIVARRKNKKNTTP